jgi:hypothetical protein
MAGPQILSIDLGCLSHQIGERLCFPHGLLVQDHSLSTRLVERSKQKLIDAAEVIEDQRLIEPPALGDRPGTRAGEPAVLERLNGRPDDSTLRLHPL